MDIRQVTRTLLRRWYLTVSGLVLTLGACVFVFVAIPQSYEAKASVLLLPPSASLESGGNPYLYLGSLGQAVDILVRALNSQDSLNQVSAQVPGATYTAEVDAATSGPILVLTADNATAAATVATLEAAISESTTTLESLQERLDVPSASKITSIVLTRDNEAAAVQPKERIRLLVGVAGAGVISTVLLVALVDGFLARRRRKSASERAQSEGTSGVSVADKDVHGPMRPRRLGIDRRNARPRPTDMPELSTSGGRDYETPSTSEREEVPMSNGRPGSRPGTESALKR